MQCRALLLHCVCTMAVWCCSCSADSFLFCENKMFFQAVQCVNLTFRWWRKENVLTNEDWTCCKQLAWVRSSYWHQFLSSADKTTSIQGPPTVFLKLLTELCGCHQQWSCFFSSLSMIPCSLMMSCLCWFKSRHPVCQLPFLRSEIACQAQFL